MRPSVPIISPEPVLDSGVQRPNPLQWRNNEKIDRIRAALQTVCVLMVTDPAYTPIFERLEQELQRALGPQETEAQRRAREFLGQMASPCSSLATCPSEAPCP